MNTIPAIVRIAYEHTIATETVKYDKSATIIRNENEEHKPASKKKNHVICLCL